jgi:hypothetical protein
MLLQALIPPPSIIYAKTECHSLASIALKLEHSFRLSKENILKNNVESNIELHTVLLENWRGI